MTLALSTNATKVNKMSMKSAKKDPTWSLSNTHILLLKPPPPAWSYRLVQFYTMQSWSLKLCMRVKHWSMLVLTLMASLICCFCPDQFRLLLWWAVIQGRLLSQHDRVLGMWNTMLCFLYPVCIPSLYYMLTITCMMKSRKKNLFVLVWMFWSFYVHIYCDFIEF